MTSGFNYALASSEFATEGEPTSETLPIEPEPTRDALTGIAAIEVVVEEAARYAEDGNTFAAEQAYARADHLFGSERSQRHAEVLVSLAMLLRRRGDHVQACSHLDMALAMCPGHRAALSQRLALAEQQRDLATAAALRVRMVDLCESAEARAHVLSAVVEDALSAAIAAALRAVELRPGDTDLRLRLGTLLDATC